MSNLLEIKDLKVKTKDIEILHGINLCVNPGEVHSIMGDIRYEVTQGNILFKGEDYTHEPADKKAKAGMFLSFQNPIEVPSITLANFIKTAVSNRTGKRVRAWDFKKEIEATIEKLNFDPSYLERDLNVGFSGGEKKKSEILQLLMLKPELAILDETDSGLDVDAVRVVSNVIREYKKTVNGALIIITHSTRILDSLNVDYTHILVDGEIAETGDSSLVDLVNKEGFVKWQK